jgi:hypothetical protein
MNPSGNLSLTFARGYFVTFNRGESFRPYILHGIIQTEDENGTGMSLHYL